MDEGDLPDSTEATAGTAVCNLCSHRWGPFVQLLTRRELQTSYQFDCPSCGPGGLLWVDTETVAQLPKDAIVHTLEVGHMAHGEPSCRVVRAQWTNVPNTDRPSLRAVQTS